MFICGSFLHIVKEKGKERIVGRLLGFLLFWMGVGIFLALIFPKCFLLVLFAALCMLIGYNLFCR